MSTADPPRLEFDPELSALIRSLNRSAAPGRAAEAPEPAPEPPPPVPERGAPPPELVELLGRLVARGGSDLLLVAGSAPVVRREGRLEREEADALAPEDVRALVLPVLGRRSREALAAERVADFAFDVPGLGRFRANVHHERGRLGACFRALPASPPALEELGLPAAAARATELANGLVLVAGPAGSGKTTTLAAVLERVLRTRRVHAITIEEPVEYLHAHHQSLVEQVEVPVDCPSFARALRAALRQSPDVLLVGELRDPESMAAALTAAETGHLVLASVHAFTAAQAVHRVVDLFPAAQQEQVRRQLAITLALVLSQRLLPRRRGGGLVAAVEVMVASDAVRNLVREGRVHQLGATIAGARSEGMRTLEEALAELVRAGRLERAVAERAAYHPDELRRLLG